MIIAKMKCVYGVLVVLATLTSASVLAEAANVSGIKQFVRGTHVEGVDYEEASKFDKSVVPILLKMLDDPQEKKHIGNIVTTLSMIGEANIADKIIDYIESSNGNTLSEQEYVNKTYAIMSLGYLVNRTGSQRATDYLVKGAYPSSWSKTPLANASQKYLNVAAKYGEEDISKYAMFGLALSGEHGRQALSQLAEKKRLEAKSFNGSSSSLSSSFVDDLLTENGKVTSMGMGDYDAQGRPEH